MLDVEDVELRPLGSLSAAQGLHETTTLPADGAHRVLEQAASGGLDLRALTARLERDGVEAFSASYRELLACIESRVSRHAVHAAGPS